MSVEAPQAGDGGGAAGAPATFAQEYHVGDWRECLTPDGALFYRSSAAGGQSTYADPCAEERTTLLIQQADRVVAINAAMLERCNELLAIEQQRYRTLMHQRLELEVYEKELFKRQRNRPKKDKPKEPEALQ
jgi:hypothetical protein